MIWFFLPLLNFFVRNDQGHVQLCRWIVNKTHIQAKLVQWRITFHSWSLYFRSHLCLDRILLRLTTTDAISAYHHNVVNSNPAHDVVYSIQHYMIILVSDLRKVDGFLWILRFPILLSICPTIISIKVRSKNENWHHFWYDHWNRYKGEYYISRTTKLLQ